MYKTVRHGENSLQYKILAQQEEGMANVRCRKSTRAVTAKFVTVIVLLVCGVIASAVLVPMILTNDFITLTGTFQKFSVSTLRRSHSGNHVVVIAKKPYGWNASRSSTLQGSKTFNASQNRSLEAKQKTVEPGPTEHPQAVPPTAAGKAAHATPSAQQPDPRDNGPSNKSPGRDASPRSPPTQSVFQDPKSSRTQAAPRDASTPTPLWHGGHANWRLESPATFATWMKNASSHGPLLAAGGVLLAVLLIVTLIFALRRSLPRRRNSAEKESPESKEDKARLLKPSVRGSDED